MREPVATNNLALHELFGRHVRHIRGGVALGSLGSFRVSYFLDLLTAVHDPEDLRTMTLALSALVKSDDDVTNHAAVASPKKGNPILGVSVANHLTMDSMLVRDEIIFSSWIEGVFSPNSKVILVDDISSDGDLLRDSINALRRSGLYVSKAFVLVNREEGNATQVLRDEGVILTSLLSLGDDQLGTLMAERRRSQTPRKNETL